MSNRTTIALSVPPAVDAALDRLSSALRKPRSVVVSELVLTAVEALGEDPSPASAAAHPEQALC